MAIATLAFTAAGICSYTYTEYVTAARIVLGCEGVIQSSLLRHAVSCRFREAAGVLGTTATLGLLRQLFDLIKRSVVPRARTISLGIVFKERIESSLV